MYVLKFGGSSLADEKAVGEVVEIVRKHSPDRTKIIVVSAQQGVTEQLLHLITQVQNKEQGKRIIQDIENRHLTILRLLLPIQEQPPAFAEIIALCNELSDIVKGCSLVGEVTPRTKDLILSFGERLSAQCITRIFSHEIGRSKYVDARQIIRTNARFGAAKVDFKQTENLIRSYFKEASGCQVVTGFIASSADGDTTTLGRNGSDYTAAVIGSCLKAKAVEIWTDVDGIMTADPRYVNQAVNVKKMSYKEAMELSHFGAKVVYPATFQPLMKRAIPLWVKNTFNATAKGTLISADSGKSQGIMKGISSLAGIALITVQGNGLLGVTQISSRLFSLLALHEIIVVLVSQASSEHSVCVAIQQFEAGKAQRLLENEFESELFSESISAINIEQELAIVAVVGENMRHFPGIAARIFEPLGRSGINIRAIAQGSSEMNISMVLEQHDLKKALLVLHQSFFEDELLKLHVYLVGTGAIGSRLIAMLEDQQQFLIGHKIDMQIYGMCNSRFMLLSNESLNKDQLFSEGTPAQLEDFTHRIIRTNAENAVFVDVTASDEPVHYYEVLLENNIAVVTANKRANTQSMERYTKLHHLVEKKNVPFYYETNVGAGLPVIHVIQSCRVSGDEIVKIEAVLSGTLNYLLSEYDGTKPFSELVKFAKENNYSEPDPRDDLSGMDVARKSLILAREAGWKLELQAIDVISLMSQKAADAASISEFFDELKSDDDLFFERWLKAKKKGLKLRYVATIQATGISIELQEVDSRSPFYGLEGTENCICFTTHYYHNYPMVIKGPGAGTDVTTAGVFADIVRIAKEWKR